MPNSIEPMAELFTFKVRNFRNNVTDLRENISLIFSSNLYIIEKGKFKCFIQNFYVAHVWNYIFIASL